jgi:hypothetical protein
MLRKLPKNIDMNDQRGSFGIGHPIIPSLAGREIAHWFSDSSEKAIPLHFLPRGSLRERREQGVAKIGINVFSFIDHTFAKYCLITIN